MEKRYLGYPTKGYGLVHDGHHIEIEFVVISPTMAGIGPIQSSRRHLAQLREHATVVTVAPMCARSRRWNQPDEDANLPKAALAGSRQGMVIAEEVAGALG